MSGGNEPLTLYNLHELPELLIVGKFKILKFFKMWRNYTHLSHIFVDFKAFLSEGGYYTNK